MPQAPLGERLALLTDLYQLTMAACYFDQGMNEEATFSLFIRKYPKNRGYFVAAGLSEALEYLATLHFNEHDLAFLESTGLFRAPFLDYLQDLRFSGEVFALPEGSIFFKDEPVLEVSAPIIEAQLVETFLINAVNLQTLIASKAARSVQAAQGRPLIDFSLRRTQGSDAGLKVARASYLVGFTGTSNVLAGNLYDIPIFGTMAHSYITSFPEEIEAFRVFAKNFPHITTLLIDTYDNEMGARKAARVGQEMAERGERLRSVRLDSGDIAAISKKVFTKCSAMEIARARESLSAVRPKSTSPAPISASTMMKTPAPRRPQRIGCPRPYRRNPQTINPRTRSILSPELKRWLNSISVSTCGARGTTAPLHNGQWFPHPAPDPVARTNAPHKTTSRVNMSTNQA